MSGVYHILSVCVVRSRENIHGGRMDLQVIFVFRNWNTGKWCFAQIRGHSRLPPLQQ